ncbi:MAG: PEP-CTERM sorting domain-containing protein [Phycisphaerae bacterium]|jgi:hypothetical protein|nr:PEP-CTERM sorting domain-containing protein [Phycisphaerae bacterium]
MMTRHLATVLAAVGLCTVVTTAGADIVIRNGGFETNWLSNNNWNNAAPDEWSVYDGGYQNAPSGWITPEAIDGEMSAFIDGAPSGDPSPWIAQELQHDNGSAVLSAEGLLVNLSFHVGRKVAPAGNFAPVVEAILECQSGGVWQTFATFTYDAGDAGLQKGSWDSVHAPLTMTGLTSGYVGQPVRLTIFNRTIASPDWYGQASLDVVTIIPEPMTIGLLGLGAAALLRRRRNNS